MHIQQMQHFPHLKPTSISIHELECRLRQPPSRSLYTPLPVSNNVQEVKVVSPFYARICTRVNCACPFHRRTRLAKLDCYGKVGSFRLRKTMGKENGWGKQNQWGGKIKYGEEFEEFMRLHAQLMRGRDEQNGLELGNKSKLYLNSDVNAHVVRTAAKDIFDYIFTHLNTNQQVVQHHIDSIEKDRDLADFYLIRFEELKKKLQASRLDCPNDQSNTKFNDKYNHQLNDTLNEKSVVKSQHKSNMKSSYKSNYKSQNKSQNKSKNKPHKYLKEKEKEKPKPGQRQEKIKQRKRLKKQMELERVRRELQKIGDKEKLALMRMMIAEMGGSQGVLQSRMREFIELELGIYESNIRDLQQDIDQNKYEKKDLQAINDKVLGRMMAMIQKSPPKEEQKKTMLQEAMFDISCHLQENYQDVNDIGSTASIRLKKTTRRDSRRSSFLNQIDIIGEIQKDYINTSAQKKPPNWKKNQTQDSPPTPIPIPLSNTQINTQSDSDPAVDPIRQSEEIGDESQQIKFDNRLAFLQRKEGQREARMKFLEAYLLENNMGQLLVKQGDCLITVNRKGFMFKLLLNGHMRSSLRENIEEYLLLVEELNYLKHPIWAKYRLRQGATTKYCRLSPTPNQDSLIKAGRKDIEDLLGDFKHLNNTFYDLKVAICPEEEIMVAYRKCLLVPQTEKEENLQQKEERRETNVVQEWGLKQMGFVEREEEDERVSVYVSPVKKKPKRERGH